MATMAAPAPQRAEMGERICRNCEWYDDGTGERRTAESGDCLNSFGPRFQTKPTDTCPHWLSDTGSQQ